MKKQDNIMNIATSNSHYDMATAQAMVAATLMASLKDACLDSFTRYQDTDGFGNSLHYKAMIEWASFTAEDLIKASSKSIMFVREDVESEAND